ncbi:hypothetical protein HHI36_010681 [Cryptolaemus montrouzieri]|uniref:Uncharacterized protein n=1 Tax=Cryptolaemus montrouzieri TaxID=559131 RepID=A0ABD2MJE1_9CUCU
MKSSANPQNTTWRVIKANIKQPKFKDMECTIIADELNKFFNIVSKLLTPTVADTEKCMKYNKLSCDYYGLNVVLLRKVIQSVVDQLCKMLNLSFEEGIFSNPLNIAKVTPIFKKGGEKTPTTTDQLLYCLLFPEFGNHLKSTTTAMLSKIDLLETLDNREYEEISSCDLSKESLQSWDAMA